MRRSALSSLYHRVAYARNAILIASCAPADEGRSYRDGTERQASHQSPARETSTRCFSAEAVDQEYRHQDSLDFIASSMRKCLNHLGPWTIGDLVFGLSTLVDKHEGLADSIQGRPIADAQLLEDLLEEVRIADAIYEKSPEEVVKNCSLSEKDIVKFLRQADRMRPAYCIALRPDKKQVLLVVRGTKSIGDAITILTGSGADFLGGHTHAGMLNSAHWLLKNETQTLRQLLEENPTYDLHFIGHSLGAGTAALYAMILRERAHKHNDLPEDKLPTCLAVATPACITEDLAQACRGYVTSLVCQNDIVPRACLWGFEQLRLEVINSNWVEEYQRKFIDIDEVKGFASNTSTLVGEQYKKVAELLTVRDERIASILGLLGEAWQSLSEKQSDSKKKLLSVTSLKIAKLPANRGSQDEELTEGQDPVAFKHQRHSMEDAMSGGEDLDKSATRESIQEEKWTFLQQVSDSIWHARRRVKAFWTQPEMAPAASSKRRHAEVSVAPEMLTASAEQAPEDIQKNEGASEGLKASTDRRRGRLPARLGKDVERLAQSDDIRNPAKEVEEAESDSEEPIGLASDGEVDAELAKLLSEVDELEQAKQEFVPPPRMLPPGKLIFLQRKPGEPYSYQALTGSEGESFGRIVLSKSMITDHLCSTYMKALQSAKQNL